MSYDFVIGSSPIPEEAPSKLFFHQYCIYDSENWTESGYLYWDATTKQFTIQAAPPSGEKETIEKSSLASVKKSVFKKN